MNVDLTPELERLVQSKLESGRYDSASAVLREAIELLDYRDRIFTSGEVEYRDHIEEGWLPRGSRISSMAMVYSIASTLN